MQNNTAFSSIKIDSANAKRERFNLTHNVNTTAGFGECQPAQVRLVVPNSKSVCGVESLVRAAPMVAPTYGDVKLKAWHHFVGMSDLLRSFTKFLVEQPYGTANGIKRQVSLPRMRVRELSVMALIGCHFTIYHYDPNLGSQAIVPDKNNARVSGWRLYDINDSAGGQAGCLNISQELVNIGVISNIAIEDSRFPGYVGTMISPAIFDPRLPSNIIPVNNVLDNVGNVPLIIDGFETVQNQDGTERSVAVSLESADHVFIREIALNGQKQYLAFAVRLSSFGKRLRKILIASGYKLNFTSGAYVNLMPLMAYYKAYFDTFGLCLYQNYESTNADVLLKQYDAGVNNFDWGNAEFCRFVTDLGNTFVTDAQDFISAHQRSDAVSTSSVGFINNIVIDPNYQGQMPVINVDQAQGTANEPNDVKDVTNHVFIDKVNHTEVTAELLKKLYKWTNRNTIAGRRIEQLLRAAGYGAYVDEQKSNFIGYTEVRINVTDINATADGMNTVTDNNSIVGETVGKAIGYDAKAANKKFSYENNEFGYWVTIVAVVPDSGYCQGIDPLLYDTDRYDMYQREMDALGFELTRKSAVVGSVDWENSSTDNGAPVEDPTRFDESFGLVPRFTRYKVQQNVANGDFTLRGTRAGYLPYMLDKYIEVGDRSVVEDNNASGVGRVFMAYKGEDYEKLPIAGNAWRFNSRYPWLNNFERIFASFLFDKGVVSNSQGIDLNHYEYTYNIYDSFIVQNRFEFITYAPMLAIEDSYGTTDENDGRGDMTMGKA